METMSNKYKQKEKLAWNQNTCLFFKQGWYYPSKSNLLKYNLTIKEKNQIRCEMNNEIFHYYW